MRTTSQQVIGFRDASLKALLFRLPSRGAFTLVELLVILATIAILAATLLPALAASKDRGKRAECASNLRQICNANFIYAADRNDYLPPFKWRDANPQYPYEMFRWNPPALPPPFDAGGGPYNLGTLWHSGAVVDGRVYYCPSYKEQGILSFDFYNVNAPWPFGVDMSGGGDPNGNWGFVRSGYSYFPQSRKTQNVNTALGPKPLPFWPSYSTSPEPNRSWICVPPFKLTEIDQTRSMVVDAIYNSPDNISHKSESTLLGLNAGFGDGHVAWQGVNQVKDGFDPNVWYYISHGSGNDRGYNLRFVMSCWQP